MSALGWNDDGMQPSVRDSKLRTFQSILLLHVLTELWLANLTEPASHSAETWYMRIALALVSVLVPVGLLWREMRGPIFGALGAILCVQLWFHFPGAGNHIYLQTYMCFFSFLLSGTTEEEQRLLLAALRWLLVLVLFFAGLQKLVHGYYDHGEIYFANEKLHPIVRYLGSAADVAKLASPAEPLRAHGLALLVLSNLAWIGEVALSLLLVARRTRALAVAGAIVFLVAIESIARELLFGALFMNALLLFLDRDLGRKPTVVFAVFYLWLLLTRLGVLPDFYFS